MKDYITKEQALTCFENAYYSGEDSEECRYYAKAFIDCIQSADVAPVIHANWTIESIGNYNGIYSTCCCSNCKDYYTRDWKEMNYCPKCGAKMDKGENEDDMR